MLSGLSASQQDAYAKALERNRALARPTMNERRVGQIRVGEAVEYEIATRLPGVPAWIVEEFEECGCPNCSDEGHWWGVGLTCYDTEAQAQEALHERRG